jgi:hypothetical protein
MVIVTTDHHFWSDRRFSVEKGGEVVVLAAPPGDLRKCLRYFGLGELTRQNAGRDRPFPRAGNWCPGLD